MAIDTITSSAAVVTATSGTIANLAVGSKVFTRKGWAIRVTPAGVFLSKATTLGGSQAAVTWPRTADEMREMAAELLKIIG